ncbi:MAG TPA: hypothetical protein GX701_09070, partial [Clostridiales bacterium]|nr:hypothetical protein [Clostridiales bacterium]
MKLKYHKKPLALSPILQKYSVRYTYKEALALSDLPGELRDFLEKGKKPDFSAPSELPFGVEAKDVNHAFVENGVTWIGTNVGAWRVDPSAYEKDRFMFFGVHKYMDEPEVLFLCSDKEGGAWLASKNQVVHVVFLNLTYRQKADYFDELTFKYISRRGMTVRAKPDKNGVYKGCCSDNDGLWTSMVAAALCFRYAVTGEETARRRATECVENMLLLATISGRKGYVDAKVRYSEPNSNRMSEKYLLKGRPDVRTIPEGGPCGMQTGYAGPANPEDWATEGEPELVRRRIQGFIARSYHVDSEDDPVPYSDGTFFRKVRNKEGKLVSIAQSLKTDDPVDIDFTTEIDSSLPVPDRLARHYRNVINPKTGKGFGDDEIIYKADTSTDELIGHFYAYAIAYKILCTGENADLELAQIFKDVMNDIAIHLVENDYCFTDAGGQATSWGKMNPEYFTNPYAFEDCTLNSLVLLSGFKTAAYITGDPRWEAEYRKLAL